MSKKFWVSTLITRTTIHFSAKWICMDFNAFPRKQKISASSKMSYFKRTEWISLCLSKEKLIWISEIHIDFKSRLHRMMMSLVIQFIKRKIQRGTWYHPSIKIRINSNNLLKSVNLNTNPRLMAMFKIIWIDLSFLTTQI